MAHRGDDQMHRVELFHRTGAGIGDLSILLGEHARNADRTNNLAIDHNRNTALVRDSSLQPENSQPNSTPRDRVFKCLG